MAEVKWLVAPVSGAFVSYESLAIHIATVPFSGVSTHFLYMLSCYKVSYSVGTVAYSISRFKRSQGQGTALYKNILLYTG